MLFFYEDIDWYSGLLIKSCYLQSIKLVNYFKLVYLQQILDKNAWGIIELDIDTTDISNGIIKVNKIACLMPDGTLVQYDRLFSNQEIEITVNLNSYKLNDDGETLSIYVATIRYNNSSTDNRDRYYQFKYGPITDTSSSEEEEYMRVLKVKPYFVCNSDLSAKYEYFQIMQFKKIKANWSMVEYNYPCVVLKSGSPIFDTAVFLQANIMRKLESFYSEVSNSILHQSISPKDIIAIRNYDLVRGPLLLLKHALSSGQIRPAELFDCLLSLMISIENVMCQKPKLNITYSHINMDACFSYIFKYLLGSVEKILSASVLLSAFTKEENGFLKIYIENDKQSINEKYTYYFLINIQ